MGKGFWPEKRTEVAWKCTLFMKGELEVAIVVLLAMIGLIVYGHHRTRIRGGEQDALSFACSIIGGLFGYCALMFLLGAATMLLIGHIEGVEHLAEIEMLKQANTEIEAELLSILPDVHDSLELTERVFPLVYQHGENVAEIRSLEKEFYDEMPLFAFLVFFGH